MNKREFKILISQIKQQYLHAEQVSSRNPIQGYVLCIAARSNAVNLYKDLVEPSKLGVSNWPSLEAWLAACKLQ